MQHVVNMMLLDSTSLAILHSRTCAVVLNKKTRGGGQKSRRSSFCVRVIEECKWQQSRCSPCWDTRELSDFHLDLHLQFCCLLRDEDCIVWVGELNLAQRTRCRPNEVHESKTAHRVHSSSAMPCQAMDGLTCSSTAR